MLRGSAIAAKLSPEIIAHLVSTSASKWKKAEMGKFMTELNRCHSIEVDDPVLSALMHKFSDWAGGRFSLKPTIILIRQRNSHST